MSVVPFGKENTILGSPQFCTLLSANMEPTRVSLKENGTPQSGSMFVDRRLASASNMF